VDERKEMKMERTLSVKPRYYRWHVDLGVEWVETNTNYGFVDWGIPLSQAALVLVDVWDRHYLKDTDARAEAIIQQKYPPLLNAARQAGLRVIHAPDPIQAKKYPDLRPNVGIEDLEIKRPSEWPPAAFRLKTEEYKSFAQPFEPREKERSDYVTPRTVHPLAEPTGEDVVIATGEELHRYCQQQQILFLFFLGFNTNACILLRDYGTIEMSKRGYEVIIVRDCTTGMESCETHDQLSQTRGTILFLEMFGKYSILSEELIAGLIE
jgi:nicotinamidase-related amidase